MNLTAKSASDELDELLGESVDSAKARARSAFDELAGGCRDSLVLFGAGNLGRKTLQGLRRAGVEPLAFTDNNSALWGKAVEGLTVLSPQDAAAKYGRSAAFIMTIWRGEGTDTMAERCQPLADLGCEHVLNFGVVFWKYPEAFLPHYSLDLPHKVLTQAGEVRRAFALWEDEASRKGFDALPRPVKHPIYFPDDLVAVAEDEVFVDCGAFDGDTLASFLEERGAAFGRFIAFEADPANFRKLGVAVGTLPPALQEKICVYSLAVGARREKVRFAAMGTESSFVGRGSLEIDCAPLDAILTDLSPTWIKMDIEGSELDALSGARGIIAKRSPVLAVCVYHQQDHVWRIPLLMRELSSDYHFFLRPHLAESWDLVCYAIPSARLRKSA